MLQPLLLALTNRLKSSGIRVQWEVSSVFRWYYSLEPIPSCRAV